jgi:hypothetical protein
MYKLYYSHGLSGVVLPIGPNWTRWSGFGDRPYVLQGTREEGAYEAGLLFIL